MFEAIKTLNLMKLESLIIMPIQVLLDTIQLLFSPSRRIAVQLSRLSIFCLKWQRSDKGQTTHCMNTSSSITHLLSCSTVFLQPLICYSSFFCLLLLPIHVHSLLTKVVMRRTSHLSLASEHGFPLLDNSYILDKACGAHRLFSTTVWFVAAMTRQS